MDAYFETGKRGTNMVAVAKAALTGHYIERLVDPKWLPVVINNSKVIMLDEAETAFVEAFKAAYSDDIGVFSGGYWSVKGAGIDEVTGVRVNELVRIRFYLREGKEYLAEGVVE